MILSKSIEHTEICHILAIFKIKFQIFGKKFPKCAGVDISTSPTLPFLTAGLLSFVKRKS
jgi:hypothetical protein